MTTPQMRRIKTLEDHRGGTLVNRWITFVAESTGFTPAVVVAEAENLMAATAGMTDAARNERLAADLGRTVAEIEADLVEGREDFARWDRERNT